VDNDTTIASKKNDRRIAVRVEHHDHPIDDHWTSHNGVRIVTWNIGLILSLQLLWLASSRLLIAAWIITSCVVIWLDRKEFREHFDASRDKHGPILGVVSMALFLLFAVVIAPFFLTIRTVNRIAKARRRRSNERFDIRDSPFESRVTCHGEPAELADIVDIPDASFEPAIFLGRADAFPKEFASWGTAGLIVVSFSIIVIGMVFTVWLTKRLSGALGPLAQGAIFGTLPVIGVPIIRLWRTVFAEYYRIVPGRMDIMKFGPFRTRGRILNRINLRGATVSAKFTRQTIAITTADNPPEEHSLTMATRSPHAMTRAILRAAICTSPTPPLPDDELLG